ncbi:uncharacterized protein VICG_01676 [Vittaforma corneae ATCC 50505]|uniref:Uncharacterized protein n=1 Tax=Vittaforma corneae (strain ATCC 50505) TaxID=993615 RepID=L2GK95_VITCO|nr:uncharacterized protein VICG_01676 [Vittaforma corneae ATCC 50505]ELA41303.1 hypothetical protein VICG_01676 [Vittaforma corneae ATCC 50505]
MKTTQKYGIIRSLQAIHRAQVLMYGIWSSAVSSSAYPTLEHSTSQPLTDQYGENKREESDPLEYCTLEQKQPKHKDENGDPKEDESFLDGDGPVYCQGNGTNKQELNAEADTNVSDRKCYASILGTVQLLCSIFSMDFMANSLIYATI